MASATMKLIFFPSVLVSLNLNNHLADGYGIGKCRSGK